MTRSGLAVPVAALALAVGVAPALAASPPSTGGWRVVTTVASARVSFFFTSVVAFSARDAWAAGDSSRPSAVLVEHWGGHRWRMASLPTSVRKALAIGAQVTASSATDVWFYNQVHWARWNGRSWKTGRIPVAHSGAPSQAGQLLAFGPANAWFIGQYFTGRVTRSFAEHFNGHSWRAMPAPPIIDFVLSGASSSAICVMNGQFGSPSTGTNVLACWNGSHWRRIRLPASLDRTNATVGSILVRSLRDIWIGGGRNRTSSLPGIAWHWNGARWRLIVPRAGNFSGIVFGLLVPDGHGGLWARSDCECGGPAWRLWHYTGGRWVGPALPAFGAAASGVVFGIAAVPGTRSAWAVGVRSTSTSTSRDGVILVHGRIPS